MRMKFLYTKNRPMGSANFRTGPNPSHEEDMTKAAKDHSTREEIAHDVRRFQEADARAAAKDEEIVPVSSERLDVLTKRLTRHATALIVLPALIGDSVEAVGGMSDRTHHSLEVLLELLLEPIVEVADEFEDMERVGRLRAQLKRQ